jgi:GT2 family glycosyltransferase
MSSGNHNHLPNELIEVSIIIINYNSSHYTHQCVASIIAKSTVPHYEIIIIDNDSQEDDFQNLASLKDLPSVRIFRSSINIGFSGGNMLGVQHANPTSSFFFFLNNDCTLINDVTSILSDFLKNTPNAGIVTPQMFSPDMIRILSFGYYPSVGAILFGYGFMRLFHKEMFRSNIVEYHSPVTIPYASGSALFVRADYFKQLGGFDTSYFLYCEEEDICMRMQKHHWDVYLVPHAKFIHYGGGSTNRNLAIKKEFYISYLYFIRKFYSLPSRIALQLLFFIKLVRKFYKDIEFVKLAVFVLQGAPMKESLRIKHLTKN